MDQLMNIILVNGNGTTEGIGLSTRLRWLKPGLWAQSIHSLSLE